MKHPVYKVLADLKNADESIFPMEYLSMDIFVDSNNYVNGTRVFYSYFGALPSIKFMFHIDHKKIVEWFKREEGCRIVARHTMDRFNRKDRKMALVDFFYLLDDGILVNICNDGSVTLYFIHEKSTEAQRLLDKLWKIGLRRNKSHNISLLIEDNSGLRCIDVRNKKPKLKLDENYNEDLFPLHKSIVRYLNKKEGSGLVLFYGLPGTGKSTYIRYLTHSLRKRVIFLPTKIAANLDSPALMGFLVEYRDSILIIEDAETLIRSRENGSESNIAMLLNLTDGILGESLGIQVICTFNTNVKNIDSALLRKGRLFSSYEFKALDKTRSLKLLEKIGVADYPVTGDMTLAEIYNTKENFNSTLTEAKQAIGFRVGSEVNS